MIFEKDKSHFGAYSQSGRRIAGRHPNLSEAIQRIGDRRFFIEKPAAATNLRNAHPII